MNKNFPNSNFWTLFTQEVGFVFMFIFVRIKFHFPNANWD